MKKAEGRREYIDLTNEANLLWHQIVSRKSKNTPRIDSRTYFLIAPLRLKVLGQIPEAS
tara:strand:- start:395 stop:571 length:177 start_codon:yes stop_codon:yes gene_type:complete